MKQILQNVVFLLLCSLSFGDPGDIQIQQQSNFYTQLSQQIDEVDQGVVHLGSPEEQRAIQRIYGSDFRVFRTDHFRVISDTSLRYHRIVSLQVELFYNEVHPRFFENEMRPVTFYLINDGLDYERFMESKGHGVHKTGYGMYAPSERTLYARRYFPDGRESGVGTLFHEIIHAMVDADFNGNRRAPTWFNEGFASLFEHGRIVKGRWVYGTPNPWRETPFRAALEAGDVPTLKAYTSLTDKEFYESDQRNVYYNTGRSLCLYLLKTHGEDTLATFVDLIRRGEPGVAALEKATKMKLPAIEEGWRESIRSVNFGGDYVYRSFSIRDANQRVELLTEGAKNHPTYGFLRSRLADALYSANRYEEAIAEANAALNDPNFHFPIFAWSTMGDAYLYSFKPDEAKAAYEKALSFQPWYETVRQREFKRLIKILEFQENNEDAAILQAKLDQMLKDDN